jgi:hypothetical protein
MHVHPLVFAGSSSIHVAEVLYEHVDGGDAKQTMKVRPARTPCYVIKPGSRPSMMAL